MLFGLQRWFHKCSLFNLVVAGFQQPASLSINGSGAFCLASVYCSGDRCVVFLTFCKYAHSLAGDIDTNERPTEKSYNWWRWSAIDRSNIIWRIWKYARKAFGSDSMDSWTYTTSNTGWLLFVFSIQETTAHCLEFSVAVFLWMFAFIFVVRKSDIID